METTTILLCMCVAFLLLVIGFQYLHIRFLRKLYSKMLETETAYKGQILDVLNVLWWYNMFPGCSEDYADIVNNMDKSVPQVANMLQRRCEASARIPKKVPDFLLC